MSMQEVTSLMTCAYSSSLVKESAFCKLLLERLLMCHHLLFLAAPGYRGWHDDYFIRLC